MILSEELHAKMTRTTHSKLLKIKSLLFISLSITIDARKMNDADIRRHVHRKCMEINLPSYKVAESHYCCGCEAGQFVFGNCTSNDHYTTVCKLCSGKSFSATASVEKKCTAWTPPTSCDSLQFTRYVEGNSSTDARCVCMDGTYASEPMLEGCKKHSTECAQDFFVSRAGNKTHDIHCERCRHGFCSSGIGDASSCRPKPCGISINSSTEPTKIPEVTEPPDTGRHAPGHLQEETSTISLALFIGMIVAALSVGILVGRFCPHCRVRKTNGKSRNSDGGIELTSSTGNHSPGSGRASSDGRSDAGSSETQQLLGGSPQSRQTEAGRVSGSQQVKLSSHCTPDGSLNRGGAGSVNRSAERTADHVWESNSPANNCAISEPCLIPPECRCLDRQDQRILSQMMSDCPILNPSEHINSHNLAKAFLTGGSLLPAGANYLAKTTLTNVKSFLRLSELQNCEVLIADEDQSRDDVTDKKYRLINHVISERGSRLTVQSLIKSVTGDASLYRLFCDNFMASLTVKRNELNREEQFPLTTVV